MPTYRIDVAPLTPLPLSRAPFFSYRHDGPLPLGSLVEIPFGHRSLRGIVYARAPLPGRAPLWLKPIAKVVRQHWLTHEQRTLAQSIGQNYFSSLGNVLKHFVFPLSRQKDSSSPTPSLKTKKPRSTRHQEIFMEFGTDEAWREQLIKTLATNRTKPTTSLILVPDLLLLATLEEVLKETWADELVVLSSMLTPKQMETAWHTIRTGQAKIILGTRQAIFAPFASLAHIFFLFPEERLSYKQWDMTPYYEAEFGARELARLFGSKLTFLTPSPGLRTKVNAGIWKQIGIPKKPPTLLMVDCRKEGKGARSKPLSQAVEAELKALGNTGRALFIAKERGVSGVMLCKRCRTTARCPACAHPLAENKEGTLRCLHCQYQSSFFPKCAHCGHMHFTGFGIGTVRLERELERRFPHKRILRIDRDSLKQTAEKKVILEKLREKQYDWVISTPEIGTLLQLPKQDFIVMLEADHALAFPDFEGEERLSIETKRLLAKLDARGTLAIETFTPEERVWQWLGSHQASKLLDSLFEERKSFGYPPVTGIIKISPFANQRTGLVYLNDIQKRFTQALSHVESVELTPVYTPKQKWRKALPSFLIKYPADTPLPEKLLTLLRRESTHLKIDVHPLRLH